MINYGTNYDGINIGGDYLIPLPLVQKPTCCLLNKHIVIVPLKSV